MAQQNPMARKHPWLMAFGIMAGTATLIMAAFVALIAIAFAMGDLG